MLSVTIWRSAGSHKYDKGKESMARSPLQSRQVQRQLFGMVRLLIGRHTGIALLIIAALCGVWYWSQQSVRERMSWEGVPEAQHLQDWHTWYRVLRNDAYLVGWSDARLAPLWVIYRLDAKKDQYHLKRPEGFEQDWRSVVPLVPSTYTATGYDRGHMAPNHAIASLYGKEAQQQTFLMTNIAPQRPNLNRKLWQRLEAAEMDVLLPQMGTMWVVDGPIYSEQSQYLSTCQGWLASLVSLKLPACVAVPRAFYKMLVVPGQQGQPTRVLAFIFPQEVRGDEPLDRYLVSVSDIEQQTGINFFPKLSEVQRQQLEKNVNTTGWPMAQFVRTPSRY